ncbi:MAG: PLDc N-terminal domain-containing protein [Actinobacteria bacterium]|nr:PLDc N-terminal domain-containing protein [Actinomycetota bacterium]
MEKNTDKSKAVNLLIPVMIAVVAIAFSVTGCTEEGAAATGITAIAGFAGLYICIIAVAWLVGIFLFVVWIIMLVDCAQRDNADFPDANSNSKLMWILIIVLAGGIGAVVYYFVVKRKMPRQKKLT